MHLPNLHPRSSLDCGPPCLADSDHSPLLPEMPQLQVQLHELDRQNINYSPISGDCNHKNMNTRK